MYKRPITYTDFNGKEKTKTFYFNMTRPELMEMKRSPLYEMQEIVERIKGMDNPDEELTYAEKDEIQERMGEILRNLVIQSYGVKSEDGERFSKRIGNRQFGAGEDFVETMAYDALYMEMIGDVSNLVKFVRAIVPADAQRSIDENMPAIEQELDNVTPINSGDA